MTVTLNLSLEDARVLLDVTWAGIGEVDFSTAQHELVDGILKRIETQVSLERGPYEMRLIQGAMDTEFFLDDLGAELTGMPVTLPF